MTDHVDQSTMTLRARPGAAIGSLPEKKGFKGLPILPYIADSAYVGQFVTVDCGTEKATYIGAGAWVMHHCHVAHDATVNEDAMLSPGVTLNGYAVWEPELG